MVIDPELLRVLACPQDRGELLFVGNDEGLYNPRLRLRYPLREGVPVLLVEEAETVDEKEHLRIVASRS